jgi:hypothetical protein
MARLPNPALLATLALLASACAGLAPPGCPAGQRAMVSETVYFGTATPDGVVSAQDWRSFLDTVVTRRFPQGFTTWSALGQWRSTDGAVIRENSHVLSLVHDGGAAPDAALGEIVDEYRRRFRQEAVLRVRGATCATF